MKDVGRLFRTAFSGCGKGRAGAFLSFVLALAPGNVPGEPPLVTLSASKLRGSPGERIRISWKIDPKGHRIDRITLRMDGEPVRWKSPHVWKARPGMHVFHVQVRWGGDLHGRIRPFVLNYLVFRIDGWRGRFRHPGIYNSAEELDRIRENVTGKNPHPMKIGWKAMLEDRSSKVSGGLPYSSPAWKPHPVPVVTPAGGHPSKMWFRDDALAAYAHVLQWVVTGKMEHARKAMKIYNAWSAVFRDVITENGDVYKNLYTSWVANDWVAGAEILRHYKGGAAGWKTKDVARFERMCRVLARLSLEWIGYVGGPYGNQNQGTSTARTRLALGVFLDDRALFDSGLRLLFGIQFGNRRVMERHGRPVNLVGLTVASNGEIMEFNRDPAHGTGSFNMLVTAAEILRHQDVPARFRLYDLKFPGDEVPRLLKGSEFAARSFLKGVIPISTNPRFRNRVKGEYSELILNYYRYLSPKSYPCPWTRKANRVFRPLLSYGGYTLPWTTLTHADLSGPSLRR